MVLIDGADVRSYTSESLAKRVAVVPQRAVLFEGTIRENMRLGNENATDEEINRALDIAQARTVAEEKGGLDGKIEQGGRNLSGGQRQRLTVARALVKDADILILDDSASALDYATDAALREAIQNMEGEKTVFIRICTDTCQKLAPGSSIGIIFYVHSLAKCLFHIRLYGCIPHIKGTCKFY